MKVGCFVYHLSPFLVVLLASSFDGVCGVRIFDYIFGAGIEAFGQSIEDRVEEYYREYNGGRSVPRAEARAKGERGVQCLADVGKIDIERVFPNIPFIRNIVYKAVFEAFESEDKLEEVCSYRKLLKHFEPDEDIETDEDDRKLEEGKEEEDLSTVKSQASDFHKGAIKESHNPQRKLQAIPDYPSNINRYTSWANNNLGPYIFNNALDVRMDPGRIANRIQNSLATLRGVRIGLTTPVNAFRTGCRVAGWLELAFDPGDACRIIAETIDIGRQLVEQAIRRTRNEQTFADTHNELIDSAEFVAMLENAQTLVANMA